MRWRLYAGIGLICLPLSASRQVIVVSVMGIAVDRQC